MSGSNEKPRGSLFDSPRDRSRVVSTEVSSSVPHGLRVATAFAWRFLVIPAADGVGVLHLIQLKLPVLPLLVAILLAALLWPAFGWMLTRRFPRWLAIVISVVGTLAIVTGLLWLAVWQITQQWGSVQDRTVEAIDQL